MDVMPEYKAYVKSVNLESPPDDEYGLIAAADALAETFGLDMHPVPARKRGRPKAGQGFQTASE